MAKATPNGAGPIKVEVRAAKFVALAAMKNDSPSCGEGRNRGRRVQAEHRADARHERVVGGDQLHSDLASKLIRGEVFQLGLGQDVEL